MLAQTNNLYLLEDLDDASKTRQLAKSDLAAQVNRRSSEEENDG